MDHRHAFEWSSLFGRQLQVAHRPALEHRAQNTERAQPPQAAARPPADHGSAAQQHQHHRLRAACRRREVGDGRDERARGETYLGDDLPLEVHQARRPGAGTQHHMRFEGAAPVRGAQQAGVAYVSGAARRRWLDGRDGAGGPGDVSNAQALRLARRGLERAAGMDPALGPVEQRVPPVDVAAEPGEVGHRRADGGRAREQAGRAAVERVAGHALGHRAQLGGVRVVWAVDGLEPADGVPERPVDRVGAPGVRDGLRHLGVERVESVAPEDLIPHGVRVSQSLDARASAKRSNGGGTHLVQVVAGAHRARGRVGIERDDVGEPAAGEGEGEGCAERAGAADDDDALVLGDGHGRAGVRRGGGWTRAAPAGLLLLHVTWPAPSVFVVVAVARVGRARADFPCWAAWSSRDRTNPREGLSFVVPLRGVALRCESNPR